MSKGNIEQLDAPRYFCVRGIIDKCQPIISDLVEENLRRQLLEGMEAALCDGEYHVIRITRQEEILPPLLSTTFLPDVSEVRVTYRAEITEV